MAGAIGRPAKVALLKGRSNYLCRYRLAAAGTEIQQLSFDAPTADTMLARIQSWARTTRLGDLSEVRGLSDSHPVSPRVTSTRRGLPGQGLF